MLRRLLVLALLLLLCGCGDDHTQCEVNIEVSLESPNYGTVHVINHSTQNIFAIDVYNSLGEDLFDDSHLYPNEEVWYYANPGRWYLKVQFDEGCTTYTEFYIEPRRATLVQIKNNT